MGKATKKQNSSNKKPTFAPINGTLPFAVSTYQFAAKSTGATVTARRLSAAGYRALVKRKASVATEHGVSDGRALSALLCSGCLVEPALSVDEALKLFDEEPVHAVELLGPIQADFTKAVALVEEQLKNRLKALSNRRR